MSFPFNVYILAALAAAVTVVITLPLWNKWSIQTGLLDDPGHRKIHAQPTPLSGGLAVMTGLIAPSLLAILALWIHARMHGMNLASSDEASGLNSRSGLDPYSLYLLKYGLSKRGLELAAIFIGAGAALLLGWMDDKHELKPATKFGGQLLIASLVAISGARITLFVHSLVFSYAITILWIITLMNAMNFMDNMNGLCAGLGAISAGYFAVIAAADQQYLVALIAFLTFGALLGFLPYNFPRARAFLGDSGSHLIGYLLAVLAILPHFYSVRHPRRWAVLIPLLVLAIPLLDLVRVVILRWRRGQPFYIGDTNHLSHRLVNLGLTRTQAVLLIWLAATLIGSLVSFC